LPGKKELNDLINLGTNDKEKDNFRVAYQIKEN
jgi:hypothetical protein